MYSTAITLRPNGSMTLPKKLRSRYQTIHYIAMEVPEGVLLKPVEDIEYYDDAEGVGLRFPGTINPERLVAMFKEANQRIDAENTKKKPKRSVRKNG